MQLGKPLSYTLLAASLGFVIVQVDVTVVNIALVQMGEHLNAGISTLQWIVDSYVLVLASLLMLSGTLGDRIGAKWVFIWGLGIFSLTSLLCGLAETTTQLIIFRACQGAGAALIIPNALALLNHACRGDSLLRIKALALWNAAGGVATAAGPIIGGLCVDSVGWRMIFFINLPIGLLGIWLIFRFSEETPKSSEKRPLDLSGQLLAFLTLLSLTASVIASGEMGWNHWKIITGLIVTLIAGYLFLRVEAMHKHPMLPLQFFKNREFSASVAIGFLNNCAFYGLIFFLGLFFQKVLHYSTLQAGFAFLPLAGASVSNLIGSRIATKKGYRLQIIWGFLIAMLGFTLLLTIHEETRYLNMLFPLILIPFGLGFVIPPTMHVLLSTVDAAQSGIASALFTTMRQAGGAIGVAIFGALVNGHLSINVQEIKVALILCACLTFTAAGISALWMGNFEKKEI